MAELSNFSYSDRLSNPCPNMDMSMGVLGLGCKQACRMFEER